MITSYGKEKVWVVLVKALPRNRGDEGLQHNLPASACTYFFSEGDISPSLLSFHLNGESVVGTAAVLLSCAWAGGPRRQKMQKMGQSSETVRIQTLHLGFGVFATRFTYWQLHSCEILYSAD